jgi:hypothetical protein
MRRFGMISLGPVLGVLALKLVVVPDDEAAARFGPKIEQKNESCSHVLTAKSGRGGHTLTPLRLLRRIAPLGAAARNRALSPTRRSQLASRAAIARWQKAAKAKAKAKARKAAAAAIHSGVQIDILGGIAGAFLPK